MCVHIAWYNYDADVCYVIVACLCMVVLCYGTNQSRAYSAGMFFVDASALLCCILLYTVLTDSLPDL